MSLFALFTYNLSGRLKNNHFSFKKKLKYYRFSIFSNKNTITFRTSKLKNGRLRLYLDNYHKGISKYEKLDLELYSKPTNATEREHNKKVYSIAENIRAKR